MAKRDQLARDLDDGFAALEQGRLDDAAACAERGLRAAPDDPEAIALAAAVADAHGDTEQALARYRALAELTPDAPGPRIAIARLELRDLGDPEGALDTLAEAFEFIDEEDDLIEGILVRAEALLALDQLEDARATLAELSTSAIDDPVLALELGELALVAEDPALATRWAEVARASDPHRADALHLLGRVHEATGDRAAMIAAWQEVRRLDAAAPHDGPTITEDELAKLAADALAELPDEVHERLERAPILIDGLPSEELVADGIDPRLLGLFQGTPLPDGGDLAPTVTNILLFRDNLERASLDREQLADEVRITVLHETAHFFGLDEDDLVELGLD